MDSIETINHRGFDIKIYPDHDALDPWIDHDGMPPIIAACAIKQNEIFSNCGFTTADIPTFSRQELKDNPRSIKALFPEEKTLLQSVREWCSDISFRNRNSATDLVNEAIMEQYLHSVVLNNASKRLEYLRDVMKIKGIQTCLNTYYGSVQGEIIKVLIIATDDWLNDIGLKTIPSTQLEAYARQYTDYHFGRVYGYQIDDLEDSSWGFYGWDHEKSGLLESARTFIDQHIAEAAKKIEGRLEFSYVWYDTEKAGDDLRAFLNDFAKKQISVEFNDDEICGELVYDDEKLGEINGEWEMCE